MDDASLIIAVSTVLLAIISALLGFIFKQGARIARTEHRLEVLEASVGKHLEGAMDVQARLSTLEANVRHLLEGQKRIEVMLTQIMTQRKDDA